MKGFIFLTTLAWRSADNLGRMRSMRKLLLGVAVVSFLVGPWRPGHATMVVPRTLDQLVERADVIVVGTITKRESLQPIDVAGMSVSVLRYTLNVQDVLKKKDGVKADVKSGHPFVFEQAGVGGGGLKIAGIEALREGQEYILFMEQAGLRHAGEASASQVSDRWTTVGLEQGKFTIKTVDGKKVVENGLGNRWIFGTDAHGKAAIGTKGLTKGEASVLGQRSGPAPYDDFTSLIRKLSQ